jgi:hypothetical protein
MVGKFPTMPYWILFEFQVLEFICNAYYIVLFVLGTTKEMFVANVVDVALANRRVFMQRCAHDVEASLAQYRKANGIPAPFDNDISNP